MPKTVPNQRVIRVHRERATSDFLGIKNERWMAASRILGATALRLYLYLASNADNYLLALSPLMLILAAWIRLDSKGPVFYRQERIGFHKKPFRIIKFRTMIPEAEAEGPRLSAEGDERVTKCGRFLRKYRLDELPQFWNVLCGEMSLVGPRPEREYFISKILQKAPYYSLLHQVRPGLTSWGMVKHGYASTVDEMIERSRFDLIYLENISLMTDM